MVLKLWKFLQKLTQKEKSEENSTTTSQSKPSFNDIRPTPKKGKKSKSTSQSKFREKTLDKSIVCKIIQKI